MIAFVIKLTHYYMMQVKCVFRVLFLCFEFVFIVIFLMYFCRWTDHLLLPEATWRPAHDFLQ